MEDENDEKDFEVLVDGESQTNQDTIEIINIFIAGILMVNVPVQDYTKLQDSDTDDLGCCQFHYTQFMCVYMTVFL